VSFFLPFATTLGRSPPSFLVSRITPPEITAISPHRRFFPFFSVFLFSKGVLDTPSFGADLIVLSLPLRTPFSQLLHNLFWLLFCSILFLVRCCAFPLPPPGRGCRGTPRFPRCSSKYSLSSRVKYFFSSVGGSLSAYSCTQGNPSSTSAPFRARLPVCFLSSIFVRTTIFFLFFFFGGFGCWVMVCRDPIVLNSPDISITTSLPALSRHVGRPKLPSPLRVSLTSLKEVFPIPPRFRETQSLPF